MKIQVAGRKTLSCAKENYELRALTHSPEDICYKLMSFPVFSRRFSVSLAITIDSFFQVPLKVFTLSFLLAKIVYSSVKMDKQDSGFFVWLDKVISLLRFAYHNMATHVRPHNTFSNAKMTFIRNIMIDYRKLSLPLPIF